MKKFNSIKDFINYAPKCLFCGDEMKTIISSHTKNSKNVGILSQHKVTGTALYRSLIEKSAANVTYNYSSKIENNKLVISCCEKYWNNKQPNQYYDVMIINIENNLIELLPKIEVGILNSFVRISMKLVSVCGVEKCSGHIYSSTQILGGAKSKKLMPFFLREEVMSSTIDDTTYTIKSDYYNQSSRLDKTSKTDYINTTWSSLSSLGQAEAPMNLPMIDLSVIKNKEIFEMKAENYVTFS